MSIVLNRVILASLQHAINAVTSTFLAAKNDPNRVQLASEWRKLQIDKSEELGKAQLAFERAQTLATLFSDTELELAFLQASMAMNKVAISGMQSETEQLATFSSELTEQTRQLMQAIRKTLGNMA